MNLNIELDIESAITSALQPEKLNPILEKHITAAITSAISDATGYRSDFSKMLQEKVKEILPHGLGLDDVAKFQHCLNQSLRTVLQDANNDTIQCALDKVVRDVMPDVNPVIKLSELMEIARDGLHKEDHEPFYAHWAPSTYSSGGGWLYLDSDAEVGQRSYGSRSSAGDRKYSAKYRLSVNGDGCVYSLHWDGKDVTPSSRPDIISAFDATLMEMYVGRTNLECDIDADDVSAAADPCHD
jgi:hypothetical protein